MNKNTGDNNNAINDQTHIVVCKKLIFLDVLLLMYYRSVISYVIQNSILQ
jgi:hypothetical protein